MAVSALISLVFSAVFLPAMAFGQTPLERVIVTYSSRSIASIDLFIAQDRGFFREEGLAAEFVQVRATAAIAAIVSGNVHALGSIAQILGLPAPLPAARVFDFSMQREVNRELGVK